MKPLNTHQVIVELGVANTFDVEMCIGRGKSLMRRVRRDGDTFTVPMEHALHSVCADDSQGVWAACSCGRASKRPHELACEHAAAVFMARCSPTARTWAAEVAKAESRRGAIVLPLGDPLPPPHEGFERARTAYFAAAHKAIKRWPTQKVEPPLTIDEVKAYYYRRFKVKTTNGLKEEQMVVAAAEMQAASDNRALFLQRLREMRGDCS